MSNTRQKRYVMVAANLASAGTNHGTAANMGGLVYVDNTATDIHSYTLATGTAITTLFLPIPTADIVAVYKKYPVQEVTQVVFTGANTETITSSTKYTIAIGSQKDKYESWYAQPRQYSYTSTAVLTGTAATDRYNVYYALATKINNDASNNATAYLCYKVAYTLGTSTTSATAWTDTPTNNLVVYGSPGVQETSGVTCNAAYMTITGGSIAGNDAVGFIWLYNFSSTVSWNSGVKYITFTDPYTSETIRVTVNSTVAAMTTGEGIVVVDDAGYFYPGLGRGGINQIKLTAGFDTATADVKRTGTYSIGDGTTLLAQKAVYTADKRDIVGDTDNQSYDFSADPVAGRTYAVCTIVRKMSSELPLGVAAPTEEIVCYIDNGTTYRAYATDTGTFFTTGWTTYQGITPVAVD